MDGWTRRQAIIALVVAVAAIVIFAWMWSNRTRVEVLGVDRWEPGVLSVMVGSCNGAPEADVVDLGDGRYEIEVRTTTRPDVGHDCGDVVQIPVDPDLDSLEVVDRVSGDTFRWPTGPVTVADIDGTWRMVEVNDNRVEAGVNTQRTPEFTIDAGFLDGYLGCNRGGAELLLDESTLSAASVVSDAAFCVIPGGRNEMVATERILRRLLDEGAMVERAADRMTWHGAAGTLVFDLIDD